MKKLWIVLPLIVLMISLTLTIASAGVDWEDPALCVAGQWLLVDAARPSAVTVFIPEDTPYGNQIAGGCATPGPAVPILQVVKERGGHAMKVQIKGMNATTPTLKVSYRDAVQIKANNGKETLNFWFDLP